jgi:hypothetical protein
MRTITAVKRDCKIGQLNDRTHRIVQKREVENDFGPRPVLKRKCGALVSMLRSCKGRRSDYYAKYLGTRTTLTCSEREKKAPRRECGCEKGRIGLPTVLISIRGRMRTATWIPSCLATDRGSELDGPASRGRVWAGGTSIKCKITQLVEWSISPGRGCVTWNRQLSDLGDP